MSAALATLVADRLEPGEVVRMAQALPGTSVHIYIERIVPFNDLSRAQLGHFADEADEHGNGLMVVGQWISAVGGDDRHRAAAARSLPATHRAANAIELVLRRERAVWPASDIRAVVNVIAAHAYELGVDEFSGVRDAGVINVRERDHGRGNDEIDWPIAEVRSSVTRLLRTKSYRVCSAT